MANSSKLLDALINYKETLNNHTYRLKDDFNSLLCIWNMLSEVYNGTSANDFTENWNITTTQFNEYIEKSNALGMVLDDKIQLLYNFDKEGFEKTSTMNTSGVGINKKHANVEENKKKDISIIYINGIRTDESEAKKVKQELTNVFKNVLDSKYGRKNYNLKSSNIYNRSRGFFLDFSEALAMFFGNPINKSGKEDLQKLKRKSLLSSKKSDMVFLIGHSQGSLFIQNLAKGLGKDFPKNIKTIMIGSPKYSIREFPKNNVVYISNKMDIVSSVTRLFHNTDKLKKSGNLKEINSYGHNIKKSYLEKTKSKKVLERVMKRFIRGL